MKSVGASSAVLLLLLGGVAACSLDGGPGAEAVAADRAALDTDLEGPGGPAHIPNVPRNPPSAVHFPGTHATLQAAVDASSNGGVIILGPGAHVGSATVTGKRLFLVGAGVGATSLAAPSSAPGQNLPPAVLTVGAGADVVVRNLSLSSTGTALASAVDDATATLRVSDVAITSAAGGIVGSFEKVLVQSLTASESVFRAIYVKNAAMTSFKNVTVLGSDPDGKSVVIDNAHRTSPGPCLVRVVDSELRNGGKGGLSVIGSACPVYITRTRVVDASVCGIGLFGVSFARLQGVEVLGTKASGGSWGDGLFVWASEVNVQDSRFENNARAGVAMFGCAETGDAAKLGLSNVVLSCNPFDLNFEPANLVTGAACGTGSFDVTETADTVCRACDGAGLTCRAQSNGLAPAPM